MYWYSMNLGPKCPTCMVLEVIDEGGRGACLAQAHHKSSPRSNQPLSVVGRCYVWIESVQKWASAPWKVSKNGMKKGNFGIWC